MIRLIKEVTRNHTDVGKSALFMSRTLQKKKNVTWHWPSNYQQDNTLVNKDPLNNDYATLLIPLSQGKQEGKKTDALTADKGLI